MTRSPSPFLAFLLAWRRATSPILSALLRIAASRSPLPSAGAARLALRPRLMLRALLLCTRLTGSPSPSSIGADLLRVRLRPVRLAERSRARPTAALASSPTSASDAAMLPVVDLRSRSAVRGSTDLFPAVDFFRRWMSTIFFFFLRIAPSVVASRSSSSSTPSSISPCSASHADASASSSRSSASSLASMSGSTKSAMLWPSRISGMTSYFHSSSSSWYCWRMSMLYTPPPPASSWKSFCSFFRSPASRLLRAASTPAGMQGGRATVSRAAGMATCMRLMTSGIFFPRSLRSTRLVSSRSHATCLTSMTPASVSVLMLSSVFSSSAMSTAAPPWMPCATRCASTPISSTSARSSADSASIAMLSILLATTSTGLLTNSALMLWNSAACCLMV
mmetsp:Transcript_37313/g.94322  ORF Transcript_37313/g.94322 Transcript_37313/m.94322 type:complete len:393 (+) Transcript_37313:297-1475(+)